MSKEHVEVLKDAKKFLWNGKGGIWWGRKTSYICLSVEFAAGENWEITQEITRKIDSYLDGCSTINEWLRETYGVNLGYAALQAYRHAWLDHLIIEAEDW